MSERLRTKRQILGAAGAIGALSLTVGCTAASNHNSIPTHSPTPSASASESQHCTQHNGGKGTWAWTGVPSVYYENDSPTLKAFTDEFRILHLGDDATIIKTAVVKGAKGFADCKQLVTPGDMQSHDSKAFVHIDGLNKGFGTSCLVIGGIGGATPDKPEAYQVICPDLPQTA